MKKVSYLFLREIVKKKREENGRGSRRSGGQERCFVLAPGVGRKENLVLNSGGEGDSEAEGTKPSLKEADRKSDNANGHGRGALYY